MMHFKRWTLLVSFATFCKYAITVRDRKDLGRILKEAFYIARTGRPGPVVVDIPKNIQKAMGTEVYPTEVNISRI